MDNNHTLSEFSLHPDRKSFNLPLIPGNPNRHLNSLTGLSPLYLIYSITILS